MKVKVGNKIYDGDVEPVMVILTDADRKNIAAMSPDGTKYCCYPDEEQWTVNNHEGINAWMGEEE